MLKRWRWNRFQYIISTVLLIASCDDKLVISFIIVILGSWSRAAADFVCTVYVTMHFFLTFAETI